jgi:tRNA 2-selenouridine synthase
MFESRLLAALRALDPARAVYVEAESRKIGVLQVPDALLETMRAGPCVCVDAATPARVRFLIGDYAYFLSNPALLKEKLALLNGLQSSDTLARWRMLIDAGDWPALVGELLELHYDPLYKRSQGKNYARFPQAPIFATDDLSPAALQVLASRILASAAG